MSLRWLPSLLFAAFALVTTAPALSPLPPTVQEFELEGARCAVFGPPEPQRKNYILIYCHGYRPDGAPLDPELLPPKRAYADLVAAGWTVASTSYRRNGLIVADAMKDILALRAELVKRFGPARRIVLHGESMGGAIAVRLAETEPLLFSGVLAVGAALKIEEASKAIPFRGGPWMPVLFVNNRSELEPAASYVAQAWKPGATGVRPQALTVDRDGHVNVNQREIGAALGLLNQWIEVGNFPAVPADLTLAPHPRSSAMKAAGSGAGEAAMVQRQPIYGNITLDFQTSDFTQLGLKPGDSFTLRRGTKSFPVKWGKTYADVAQGAWVAFFDGEDRLLVAINRGNAADALGIKVGETAVVAK